MFLFAIVMGFISGSLPFSVLIGKLFLSRDIRKIGDGNPGAANVFRTGNWKVGLLALVLDYLKGVVPVAISYSVWGIQGGKLVAVMMAPLLGHHFSPFLRFRGGKGIATTFGVWTGATLWEGPVVLGVLLTGFYFLLDHDAWSVILGTIGLLLYWLVKGTTAEIYGAALANLLFLLWTHRMALDGKIGIRFNLKRLTSY